MHMRVVGANHAGIQAPASAGADFRPRLPGPVWFCEPLPITLADKLPGWAWPLLPLFCAESDSVGGGASKSPHVSGVGGA